MSQLYDHLYIYWINRALKEEEEKLLGDTFIGNWVEDGLSFLFFNKQADKELEKLIQSDKELKVIETYKMSYEQWQGGFYKPIQVADFIIIPPWHNGPYRSDLIPIFLDPGVVFGNCLHPTTRHCIHAISYLMHTQKWIKKALDLGTGTGILAIIAAKLGADKVWAVDINPLCVKTANKNFLKNKVAEKIEAKCISAQKALFVYKEIDLVIANLTYEVIEELIRIDEFFKKSIIVSGLLRSQWPEVKMHLLKKGYKIVREWEDDMVWFSALAVREE